MNIAESGCFFRYRRNTCLHAVQQILFRFFAGTFSTVEQVEQQRFVRNINHVDIINVDVFYHTATSASALEAQTYVCAHKCAVFYIDVLHTTRHFTTYYESTVSVQYRIIFNDNVLARFTATAAVFIFTGFDTDSIISRIEYTINNERVLARFQVDGVTILGIPRIDDHDIIYCEIFARQGVQTPAW